MRAASTMAFILPKAESRGRNFMPQSGARMMLSFGTKAMALRMRSTIVCGDSTSVFDRSMQPTMIFLFGNFIKTAQSRLGSAVSIEICRQLHEANSGRNEYPEGLFFRYTE